MTYQEKYRRLNDLYKIFKISGVLKGEPLSKEYLDRVRRQIRYFYYDRITF
jgi:hypothetical protein